MMYGMHPPKNDVDTILNYKAGSPERLADALDRKGDTTFVKKGAKPDAFLDILTIHAGKCSVHVIRLMLPPP